MKKKTLPLLITSILLGITSAICAFSTTNDKEMRSVYADETKDLYIQVRNDTEIGVGDTVIITSGDHGIGALGGNPVYAMAKNVPGGNNDKTKFYFSSTNAIKFRVGAGYDGMSSYSFKSLNTESQEQDWWLKTYDRYLSYPRYEEIDGYDYGYNEDGHHLGTKGDIVYRHDLDEYSSWNLDFDENGYVYISRYGEENRYGVVNNPIAIKWNNSYVQDGYFGYFFGSSNVRILRKIDISDPNDFYFYIYKPGNKLHYEPNQTAVLDGLEMDVTYTGDNPTTFKVTYANESSFFTLGQASYEEQELYFSWCGIETSYNVTVDVEKTGEHYYYTMHEYNSISDLRGTYLLGDNYNDVTNVMNLSNLATSSGDAHAVSMAALANEYDTICDKNDLNQYITNVTNNVFEVVYDTDGYYVKIGENYLCRHDSGFTYYLLYLGNRANAFKVRLGLNGTLMTPENDVFICNHSQGSSGVYLNKNDYASANESKMVLFKKEFSSEEVSELETYRISFFSITNVCKNDGSTNTGSISWLTLSEGFEALSVDSQGYLACLNYVHNDEEAGSLNDMVDRYDYIISKYTTAVFPDFMNRIGANTHQDNYHASQDVLVMNNNIALIVVIIAISLSLSFVPLMMMKRRKTH